MHTEATDADDGDHEAVADGSATIVDTVSYTGLTPGKEYTLTGTLVDKETGKPVRSDGKVVTSTVAFVTDTANGTQEVTFTFGGMELAGNALVTFESLALEGQEVAAPGSGGLRRHRHRPRAQHRLAPRGGRGRGGLASSPT
ncbi:VaFE repeat-containing surface-anchored protein [Lancefieldella sp. Marseille-Q7238]|uniref:VaFE repeat-containing surface-anchored protein n=1 Tax=Lancefieldella sp. Marseille-Q7238 TaxID=3022127 RepID=UPI0024A8239B|nr:VaFE repeat-containing surface-anchored protein [Lancefieldella sp. Marseille-Q7238]